MALLFFSKVDSPVEWAEALRKTMPELEVRVWPEVGERGDIEVALVWYHPPGELLRYPNLQLIASLGAGVDHLMRDTELPPGVPITRIVDENLTLAMSEYVVLAVLSHHRQARLYAAQQRAAEWREHLAPLASERRVGIMGLGVLGADVAQKLVALGFDVAGWSRTAKDLAGVRGFAGSGGLGPFLARTEILVCMLPLTPATDGIVNATLLAGLPAGAAVINCARGRHVVDQDLLAALNSGHIGGATLDVFRTEPLPAEHPYWRHPSVTVTPHIAALTNAQSGANLVVDNIRRLRAGQPLLYRVDPEVGY